VIFDSGVTRKYFLSADLTDFADFFVGRIEVSKKGIVDF
jgi:hypothetical protein